MIQVIASLTTNPDEPEALKKYFEIALPLVASVGARVSQRITMGDPVIGEQASEMILVVDYPSYQAIDDVFQSAAYRSIIEARDKAFLKYNICIVDDNELVPC
ncbi:MAG: DUF1330 domain-containing protein [Pseudomonadota bacterium]